MFRADSFTHSRSHTLRTTLDLRHITSSNCTLKLVFLSACLSPHLHSNSHFSYISMFHLLHTLTVTVAHMYVHSASVCHFGVRIFQPLTSQCLVFSVTGSSMWVLWVVWCVWSLFSLSSLSPLSPSFSLSSPPSLLYLSLFPAVCLTLMSCLMSWLSVMSCFFVCLHRIHTSLRFCECPSNRDDPVQVTYLSSSCQVL